MTERAPFRPSEGSRTWGYLLPLLIGVPPLLLLFVFTDSWVLVGGVVTAAAIVVTWVLARRERGEI